MKMINLNSKDKEELIKEFTDYVNKLDRMSTNHISFSKTIDTRLTNNEHKPTIYISSHAYLKMLLYVRDTATELAWHGTVTRNLEENWYHIKDVFLYPQQVTGATVNTDQEEYQNWLQNIEDDEVFNNIRFQGHSHVDFGTSPSSTDLDMYNTFLNVLPKNDYYIFMIMNKRGSITTFIYDLAKNLIYEDEDITIKILTPHTQDLIGDITKDKEQYLKHIVYSAHKEDDEFKWDWEKGFKKYRPEITKEEKEDINGIIDEINTKYKNPNIKIKTKGSRK